MSRGSRVKPRDCGFHFPPLDSDWLGSVRTVSLSSDSESLIGTSDSPDKARGQSLRRPVTAPSDGGRGERVARWGFLLSCSCPVTAKAPCWCHGAPPAPARYESPPLWPPPWLHPEFSPPVNIHSPRGFCLLAPGTVRSGFRRLGNCSLVSVHILCSLPTPEHSVLDAPIDALSPEYV